MFLLTNRQLLIKSRISQTWDIGKFTIVFTKIRRWLLLRIKWIQIVRNTECNLNKVVIGKTLLLTCRPDALYVLLLSYFSKVHMSTHACICWWLNLKLKELSPNQILKAWFKNVLFVIVILNNKKLFLCGHHILVFHYT